MRAKRDSQKPRTLPKVQLAFAHTQADLLHRESHQASKEGREVQRDPVPRVYHHHHHHHHRTQSSRLSRWVPHAPAQPLSYHGQPS